MSEASHADRCTIISIVVPVYNEEEILAEFHRRLINVFTSLPYALELIYVNDGSSDGTLAIIGKLIADDNRVALLDLSRNFGKEIAITAGLDHATGEAAIVIDADLQDPPELIPDLIAKWSCGADIVYARRVSRDGETWLKKTSAAAFYAILKGVSRTPIKRGVGDYRLLSRPVLDALAGIRERNRFMKGLFDWVGFNQVGVPYRRDPRAAGRTSWTYWQLWNFALDGITSFSTAPLRLATYLGLFVSAIAFLYAGFIIYKTLAFGEEVRGYPSLMVVILFLGGVQLAAIGVIGEYLGRMFEEAKQRPLYFLRKYIPAEHSSKDDPDYRE